MITQDAGPITLLTVDDIYLVVAQLQANLIAPRVMGTAVRLSAAVIMLALTAGFAVGGLLGSLLAVPIIATLRNIFSYLHANPKILVRLSRSDRQDLASSIGQHRPAWTGSCLSRGVGEDTGLPGVVGTLDRYAHLFEDDLDSLAESMDARYGAAQAPN